MKNLGKVVLTFCFCDTLERVNIQRQFRPRKRISRFCLNVWKVFKKEIDQLQTSQWNSVNFGWGGGKCGGFLDLYGNGVFFYENPVFIMKLSLNFV